MPKGLYVFASVLAFVAQAAAQSPRAPFEASELAQALAPRAPSWVQAELRVAAHDGQLTLTLRDQRRDVSLEGAAGPEAARVVALVAADMAEDIERAAAARATVDATQPAQPPAPAQAATLDAGPREQLPGGEWPRKHVRDRMRFSLDASVQRGVLAAEPWIFDLGIGAGVLLRQPWWLSLRAGYWGTPAEVTSLMREVRLHGLSVRLLAGVRLGIFEIGAGPVIAPFWAVVEGESSHAVLPGGCVQWSVVLPLGSVARMLARVQLDVLGNRTEVNEWGQPASAPPVFTTPRFMPGLALGFAWGWS